MAFHASVEALLANYTSRAAQGRRSVYWAFFKTTKTDESLTPPVECLQCLICEGSPARSTGRLFGQFLYSSLNGTNNLDKHTRSSHPELLKELVELLEDKLPIKTKRQREAIVSEREVRDVKQYSRDVPKQQRFEKDLVLLTVMGLLPLSIVENKWFRRLCSNLDPKVKHMSRKELTTNRIPGMNRTIKEDFLLPCLATSVGGSLQFDLWMTTRTQEIFSMVFSIMDDNFNMRFINLGMVAAPLTDGVSLASTIKTKIEEFSLKDKLVALIKDQGANLRKATELLQREFVENTVTKAALIDHNCISHALNKVLKSVYESNSLIKVATKEFKAIATYTKKSTKGARMLTMAQTELDVPTKKLLSPIPTRWASFLVAFESALNNEGPIKRMLVLDGSDHAKRLLPSEMSWHVTRLLNISMRKTMGVLFNSQGSCFISDTIVSLVRLFLDFQSESTVAEVFPHSFNEPGDGESNRIFLDLKGVAEDIAEGLRSALKEFLAPFEMFSPTKSHYWFGMLLDPRHKRLKVLLHLQKAWPCFQIRRLYEDYYNALMDALVNIYKHVHHLDETNQERDSFESSDLDSELDFDVHLDGRQSEDLLIVKQEFERFREAKEIDCPGQFWRTQGHKYPNCAILAKQIFSICSSQAECERSFSIAGILCQNRRNRMSVENLNELLFLNRNLENYMESKDSTENLDNFLERESELLELYMESFELEVPVDECDTCLK